MQSEDEWVEDLKNIKPLSWGPYFGGDSVPLFQTTGPVPMAADWEAYNLFSSIDKVVGTQRQVQFGWLCVVTDDFQTKPALGFQERTLRRQAKRKKDSNGKLDKKIPKKKK